MLTLTQRSVRIAVRVQPRRAPDRVVGARGGALKVQVGAPPADGAANDAVIELLARVLRVPRRSVTIVRGASSRDKVVEVASEDPAALARQIDAVARGCVDNPGGAD